MKQHPVMMITGAARGLGRALARRAAADYRLVLVDIAREEGEALASELRQDGAQVFFCRADVRREQDLRHATDRLLRRWGRLDVLINNAGVTTTGPLETLQPEHWDAPWQVNVMGAVHGCRAALTLMKRQGSGYLVNVAALAGISAPPGMAACAASNAALIALSETMAAELAGLGIQVSVVCPDLFAGESPPRIDAADTLSRARLERELTRTRESADQIAARMLRAMSRRPLYILPQSRTRRLWYLKRLAPTRFVRRMAALGERLRRYS